MTFKVISTSPPSSSRPNRELEASLTFSEDYQLVTDWYNLHKSSGSTTIRTMQLRKEHGSPFHEFVTVLTEAGYSYRVDRGTGGPVLDSLSEQGAPPHDTIALESTSGKKFDKTSYCAIELRWGDNKTIDLKLILDICFEIHNASARRYRLLTHNCYFFAQTIITIAVRKTVALGNGLNGALNMALKRSMTWELFEGAAKDVLPNNWKWTRELAAQVVEQVCRPAEPLMERLLEGLQERLLEGLRERLQEWIQKREQAWMQERERERLLELEWELRLGQQLLGRLQGPERWGEQELGQREQPLERRLERLLEQLLERRLLERQLEKQEQKLLERELPEQERQEWQLEQEWHEWLLEQELLEVMMAQELVDRELVEQKLKRELLEQRLKRELLERRLAQLLERKRGRGLQPKQKRRWRWWRKREEQEQENEQKEPEWESRLAQAQTLTAEILFGVLGRLITGEDLRVERGLGLFLDSSVSKFVEFPASFSASLKCKVSHVPLLSKCF